MELPHEPEELDVNEILKWTSMTLATAIVVGGTAYGVVVAWGMLQSQPELANPYWPSDPAPGLVST